LEAALARLTAWEEARLQRAAGVAAEIAALLEAFARENHAWRSRSGTTEASIRAEVAQLGDFVEIVLSAGTDYARFLELARSGRWAWLWEAVEANGDAVLSLLETGLREGGDAQ
jgi:hypothetical protein